MFCRVNRKLPNPQIGHVSPVVRGRIQQDLEHPLLCPPCNQRKGIQANEEFHTIYWKPLRGVKPGTPTPLARLRESKARTLAHDQVRKFKRTKHINPATKVRSGSLAACLRNNVLNDPRHQQS